uniref:TIL domain-containing protein n=1 Tax=Romanomermis culicivorax TaxID=13658 RepID=A0A915IIP5_ROMCU
MYRCDIGLSQLGQHTRNNQTPATGEKSYGINMKWRRCGNPCERTCRDVVAKRPENSKCPTKCARPGCYCTSAKSLFTTSIGQIVCVKVMRSLIIPLYIVGFYSSIDAGNR